jgi:hypothetical protein
MGALVGNRKLRYRWAGLATACWILVGGMASIVRADTRLVGVFEPSYQGRCQDDLPVLGSDGKNIIVAWRRQTQSGNSFVCVERVRIADVITNVGASLGDGDSLALPFAKAKRGQGAVSHLQIGNDAASLVVGLDNRNLLRFPLSSAAKSFQRLTGDSLYSTPRAVTFGTLEWIDDGRLGLIHLSRMSSDYPDVHGVEVLPPGGAKKLLSGSGLCEFVSVGRIGTAMFTMTRTVGQGLTLNLPRQLDGVPDTLRLRPEGLTTNVAASPDGELVAFLVAQDPTRKDDAESQIYDLNVLTVRTGEVRRLLEGVRSTHLSPAWLPDGSGIAVVTSGFEAMLVSPMDGETQLIRSEQALSAYDVTTIRQSDTLPVVAVVATHKTNNLKRIFLYVVQ